MVPDWLWAKANRAIAGRTRTPEPLQGDDHPLANIRRNSRGPLSNLFVCVCGAKMWAEGRNEGGYKCSGAHNGECWNKATALKTISHQAIAKAVIDKLLVLDGSLDALVDFGQQLDREQGHWREREAELRAREQNLKQRCKRLVESIETSTAPPAPLVEQLTQRTKELEDVQASIEELLATAANQRPSSAEDIRARIQDCRDQLLDMDARAGSLLRQLIDGQIVAVPYQQFGTNKVVLRAEFKLKFVKFLPEDLLAALKGAETAGAKSLENVEVVVDLFEPSAAPRHALAAAELTKTMTLVKVGDALGISKRQAHQAAQLGREMSVAGATDPYVRLTEPPKGASRWRVHPKFVSTAENDDGNGMARGLLQPPPGGATASRPDGTGHVPMSSEEGA